MDFPHVQHVTIAHTKRARKGACSSQSLQQQEKAREKFHQLFLVPPPQDQTAGVYQG